ncbi:MAG: DUF429 domain-containing protein [Hyphomicrobiales bacterium]|nr:DUF429 domain-containing protein [Hyphomicrobiales bacterium]
MSAVAGADGCRRGWLVVTLSEGDPGAAVAHIHATFAEAIAAAPGWFAVDIPIGLPGFVTRGRSCDTTLRAKLGGRQSSVFAVPARAAVMQTDYRAACETAFALSDPPRKVSQQCFHLFPKIREVDSALDPKRQERVFECHPEGAFWALNGCAPLAEPKKLKSRPYPPGLALRRALLERAGFAREFLAASPFRAAEAGADDFLDACACAWTALRRSRGEAIRFPDAPERDERGLRMEIWA